jgi:hypothetical protein
MSVACAVGKEALYLSDMPEHFLSIEQGWGVLGWDAAAHEPKKAPMPLTIGQRTFAKGLGHHANGTLVIAVDDRFEHFEAEIGIQTQAAHAGSVIFCVSVDGRKQFESGILTQADPAQPVKVSLEGARELRLEVRDAADGITCDMANWANARLTLAKSGEARAEDPGVDIAPFGRVVTWDPERMDGCRAGRTEEFRAEDVFLETDVMLAPATGRGTPAERRGLRPDGTFVVPVSASGMGCIGLQWLERWLLQELALEFAPGTLLPPSDSVEVQGWFGESAWQGKWQRLPGTIRAIGQCLQFTVAPRTSDGRWVQTQKIRWLFPAAKPAAILAPATGRGTPAERRGLRAFARSLWATAQLWFEVEQSVQEASGRVAIVNGRILSEIPPKWTEGELVQLRVRYSRRSAPAGLLRKREDAGAFHPTVLQFDLPSGRFGVAVEDVLAHQCVYLPDHGLFLACDPQPIRLSDYKNRIATQKTILQQVRERPEQTLEQALAKTHHEIQCQGPVLLSLAADNTKFVVERDGTIRFQIGPPPGSSSAEPAALRPQFGTPGVGSHKRSLDGGWLPIPLISNEQAGLHHLQRTFVAPLQDPGRQSVCVAEFTLTNTNSTASQTGLALTFLPSNLGQEAAEGSSPAGFQMRPCSRGFLVIYRGRNLALVDTSEVLPLEVRTEQGTVRFEGALGASRKTRCLVYLPGAPVTAEQLLELPSVEHLRMETERYWADILSKAAVIRTPDSLLNDLIRASQVRCWIAARQDGDGSRIAPWIAAMAYGPLESEAHSVIRGMDFMGHTDFAQRGLDFFVHRYNSAGYLTTGYTTFGTAWHLWTLAEHWQLHRDVDWMQRVAPEIARVGHWIVRQTEKTKRLDGLGRPVPEYGLMPPGVLADWNAFAYHFCLNAYYFAALNGLGATLRDVGHPDADLFARRAGELREDILRAYRWTQAQSPVLPLRNGTWIPAYPSQVHSPGKLSEFFPGQDAGRSGAYDVELGAHQMVPTGVFDPDDPEVTRMMEHMEDVQFLSDGWFDYPAEENRQDWFNLGGFAKCQPYYARNAEIYALRDDIKPFLRSYFNTLAAMLNPEVLTFWEHFHTTGAWDKTHETGYFLHQTRLMLVMERGEELWLAPLIPSRWLEEGKTLTVQKVPTRFGQVSYQIVSGLADGVVEVSIDPPVRRPPAVLVLRLRHPDGKSLRSVTIDGQPHADFEAAKECIRVRPVREPIHIRAEF